MFFRRQEQRGGELVVIATQRRRGGRFAIVESQQLGAIGAQRARHHEHAALTRAVLAEIGRAQLRLRTQLAAGFVDRTPQARAVLRGQKRESRIETQHALEQLLGAGRLAAPHTVIVLGKGAHATVIEEQLSETADAVSLHAGATEVFLGEDAKLVYGSMQDWGRNVYHYSNQRASIGRGAELQWIQTLLGARMVKTNSYFNLAGSGAQAFVHGFMFGDQRQHFHLHTLQRHLEPHTTSDLLIKCCLKDKARSVYQGLIQVAEGAQRTDAYQANRNLLLSDQARADSIPGLEILANDVRCTHGATLGYVEPEHLYYLMARGLPRVAAQRLIVEAFFEPVIGRIPLETVRERLRGEIERKID